MQADMQVQRIMANGIDVTNRLIGHKYTHALKYGDLVLTPAGIGSVVCSSYFRYYNTQDQYLIVISINGQSIRLIGNDRLWFIFK